MFGQNTSMQQIPIGSICPFPIWLHAKGNDYKQIWKYVVLFDWLLPFGGSFIFWHRTTATNYNHQNAQKAKVFDCSTIHFEYIFLDSFPMTHVIQNSHLKISTTARCNEGKLHRQNVVEQIFQSWKFCHWWSCQSVVVDELQANDINECLSQRIYSKYLSHTKSFEQWLILANCKRRRHCCCFCCWWWFFRHSRNVFSPICLPSRKFKVLATAFVIIGAVVVVVGYCAIVSLNTRR